MGAVNRCQLMSVDAFRDENERADAVVLMAPRVRPVVLVLAMLWKDWNNNGVRRDKGGLLQDSLPALHSRLLDQKVTWTHFGAWSEER